MPNLRLQKRPKDYVYLYIPNHPRANLQGYVYEHIIIAERALGYYLPIGVVVHHHNQIKHDNANLNLVICENENYHRLIHSRLLILLRGGDPDKDLYCHICLKCKPKNLFYYFSKLNGSGNKGCKECLKNQYLLRKSQRNGLN